MVNAFACRISNTLHGALLLNKKFFKKNYKKQKHSKGYVATQIKTGSVVVMIRVKLAV